MFCIFSSFDVTLSKTKILVFGRNKRKLNQEVFTYARTKLRYLVMDLYSHGHLEPSSKRQRIARMKTRILSISFTPALKGSNSRLTKCLTRLENEVFNLFILTTWKWAPSCTNRDLPRRLRSGGSQTPSKC